MVGLNRFWDTLPNIGNTFISNLSTHYREWRDGSAIPAFHSQEGAWVFKNGKILLNQENLETLVDHPRPHCDTSFWLGVATTLKNYRAWYFKELKNRKAKANDETHVANEDLATPEPSLFEAMGISFEQTLHHLMGKIYRKLKRRYDETTDGVSFYLDEEGELMVNGIRVERFLVLAKRYPTDKAKTFLKGLKDRLSVILSNRQGNPNYDKIHQTTTDLFAEIDRLLAERIHQLKAPECVENEGI